MRKRSRKETLKLIGGVAAAVLGIVLFAVVLFTAEKRFMRREDISDSGDWELESDEDGLYLGDKYYYFTDSVSAYLFIGTDASSDLPEAEGVQGDLADFLALLVINDTQKCFGILQLDRDTMTQVTILDKDGADLGEYPEQLCTAHWYGGTEEMRGANTINAVSASLGYFPIDGYYGINMKDISAVNHVLGGVPVTIQEDLTSIDPSMKKGARITLSDEQVEKYLRARMSVGEGTNKERMSRQMQYMQNAYSIAFKKLDEDPSFADEAYDELTGKVFTDQYHKTFSQIVNKIAKYENRGILTFEGESRMGDTFGDGDLHAEFYPDPESIAEQIGKLIRFERIEKESEDDFGGEDFGTSEEAAEDFEGAAEGYEEENYDTSEYAEAADDL